MKIILKTIIAAFILLSTAFAQTEDQVIGTALKSGSSKDISKYFSPTITLKIIDKEDVYSKVQAEMIIKDFFSRNQPQAYNLKHNGSSKNGAQYTIGHLTTASGNYRTYYFIKKTGDTFLIQELRIEKE